MEEHHFKEAKKACKGLPIEIRLQDYRKLNEKFDRIISIFVSKLFKRDNLFILTYAELER